MKSKFEIIDLALYLCAFALFLLCVYRAATLSMTHDESSTYFFFRDSSIYYFLTNSAPWTSANNHLLNTFLFQQSINLFGDSDFTIRLPNVLSFALYLYSTIALGKALFKSKLILFVFFLLACANPYIFDFFSLNRGYGLSMAFQMTSMLMAWRFLNEKNYKNFLLLLACLFLMSFSLFSTLILIPTFLGALLVILFFQNTLNKKMIAVGFGFIALCGLMFYTPLKALSNLGEFNYGAETLFSGLLDFSDRALYSKKYLGASTSYFFLGLLIVSFSTIVFNIVKKKYSGNIYWYLFFLVLSVAMLILGMVLSKLLFGTLYPVERKTILFLPFASLLLAISLKRSSFLKFHKITTSIIIVVLVFHFFYSHQLNRTKEWWYDFDTKNMITILKKEVGNEKVNLSVNWGFYPTTQHYLKRFKMDNVRLLPYSKKLQQDAEIDYFIGYHNDYKILKNDFDEFYRNESYIRILKRKID